MCRYIVKINYLRIFRLQCGDLGPADGKHRVAELAPRIACIVSLTCMAMCRALREGLLADTLIKLDGEFLPFCSSGGDRLDGFDGVDGDGGLQADRNGTPSSSN